MCVREGRGADTSTRELACEGRRGDGSTSVCVCVWGGGTRE